MRWTLLKDADELNLAQLTDLEALVTQYTTNRTARA
jgi:transposase